MANKELKVGDVLAAKYTYGDEILSWKFWYVTKITSTMIEIAELKRRRVYDDGKEGPHYYDAPYHYQPELTQNSKGEWCYTLTGARHRRKVTYTSYGEPIVKTEEYWKAIGTWDGRPLPGYNLH